MATYKLQKPLTFNEHNIYPLTTVDQVRFDDGSKLEEKILTVDLNDTIEGEPALINADLLGGIAADQYALKSEIGTGGNDSKEWLDVDLTEETIGETGYKPQNPITKNGENVYPITTYDQIIMPDGNKWDGTSESTTVVDAVKVTFSATLMAANWSEAAPYAQTITVEGITADDKPYVFVDLSAATEETVDSIESEWAKVKYALTSENAVTFYCIKEAPAVDIPVEGEVIRTEVNYTNAVGVEF